jgi:hypothetical protein
VSPRQIIKRRYQQDRYLNVIGALTGLPKRVPQVRILPGALFSTRKTKPLTRRNIGQGLHRLCDGVRLASIVCG